MRQGLKFYPFIGNTGLCRRAVRRAHIADGRIDPSDESTVQLPAFGRGLPSDGSTVIAAAGKRPDGGFDFGDIRRA